MSLPFNGRRPYVVTVHAWAGYIATAVFTAALVVTVACVKDGWKTERAVTVTGPARVSPFECR
jgi:hypothetical protein